MNPRYQAVRDVSDRKPFPIYQEEGSLIERFGKRVFSRAVMEKMLPKEVYSNLLEAIAGKARINHAHTDAIAKAMKEWAIDHGATHFTHWFQPMTGLAAEKHDAFIDWKNGNSLIEKFSGKMLLRGEPDASSFPSGGLRSTYEARGYTSWDPSTPAFLWESAGNVVLCIPSVFYSWKGEALDLKIPLLRSDAKINEASLRLLKFLGIDANHVYSTLGCEQEYFLVDKAFYTLRPDLVMAGRTVYGAPAPKGQELEDHYFITLKERVVAFMTEFESMGYELGIPLKTRHSEVAPFQFEIAPIFEKASVAVDHNLILMELMRHVAAKHDLACLVHEKPFAAINGSGKHNNWSLATDQGMNLLDPTDNPSNSLSFLIMVSAVLHAIHRHAALLRASIASAGNDHRLGGNEAPPAIISVYLGETLDKILDCIEKEKTYHGEGEGKVDLMIPLLPALPKESTDRNRTSPFAFTGNKFEFRAVGASANCSFPVTVINAVVAESLNQIVDELEAAVAKKGKTSRHDLTGVAMPIIRKYLKMSRPIRFLGNNYSSEWAKEAKKRGLPIIERSFHAFEVLESKPTQKVFEEILSKVELDSRYEVQCEHYAKVMNIEVKLMVDMFRTQILPAAMEYQKEMSRSIEHLRAVKGGAGSAQVAELKILSRAIDTAIEAVNELEMLRQKALSYTDVKRPGFFCDKVGPQMLDARYAVDELEKIVDDRLWPLPKYRELLFLL